MSPSLVILCLHECVTNAHTHGYMYCLYIFRNFNSLYICIYVGEKWHTGAMVAFESTAEEDEGQQKYK